MCCGAGNCVLTVPGVFDQDDAQGLVVLLVPEPPAALYDAVHDAVYRCPSGAIEIDP